MWPFRKKDSYEDDLIKLKQEVNKNMVWKPFNKAEQKMEAEAPREIPVAPKVIVEAPKEYWKVVRQIPTQEIRKFKDDDGNIVNLITYEEYECQKASDDINGEK